MDPLNPLLYRNLLKAFNGHVRIANQGEHMVARHVSDWISEKSRPRLQISSWGESYCVNCPFCTDTRQRLSINHRWAMDDRETGDDNLHLAKCFNEECLSKREKQKQLHGKVFPLGMCAGKAELPEKPVAPTTVDQPVIALPPGIRLDRLPPDHLALQYLTGRGFDTDLLARDYGLRYSPACNNSNPALYEPRIVIPIYAPSDSIEGSDAANGVRRLKLVGWQARPPREDLEKRCKKYLTSAGTQKSHLLYGLPYARKTKGPVVIVEGVADAWRVGKCGVALLGKSVSQEQCGLIVRYFARRPVIVFVDREAAKEGLKIRDKIRNARAAAGDGTAVELAIVPPGRKDPGECTPEQIHRAIENAIGKRGKQKSRKKAKV